MVTNLELRLFKNSLDLWGVSTQINILAEEAGELCVAALHLNRRIKNKDNLLLHLAEEIADVEFMIAEIKTYFPKLQKEIDDFRLKKANRLDLIVESALQHSKASGENQQ